MDALATIVDVFIAATVGSLIVAGASLTGQNETLCDWQGGTYEPVPHGEIVCPDGQWSALVGLEATPQPSMKGQ